MTVEMNGGRSKQQKNTKRLIQHCYYSSPGWHIKGSTIHSTDISYFEKCYYMLFYFKDGTCVFTTILADGSKVSCN